MACILVVDDQETNRVTLDRILQREGWEVVQSQDGRRALELLRSEAPDVIVTDLKMPGMNGLELLKAAKTLQPEIEVILMTAYGTVETAVDAMKEGAYDYVTKPLRRTELVGTITKALEKRGLIRENRWLREQLEGGRSIVGSGMRSLLEELDQVAPTDASVMLVGESGTGKGLLARALHRRSRRSEGPLVTVNCAAIPENLLESELFGHEAGAFTGATSRKEGRFDLAQGGTLFLDEITEMSPALQVKLLRVLQEGEYERVGGTKTLNADARIISASNQDVAALVKAGGFRADLFYRLNVIQLRVPALRERIDDIPLLASHFLALYAEKNEKQVRGIQPKAMERLIAHHWPGNVRELENALERSVVLCRTEVIEVNDLPPALRQAQQGPSHMSFEMGTPLKDIERSMIEETLRQCGGDRKLAASLLGITSRTIYRREAEWTLAEMPEEEANPNP